MSNADDRYIEVEVRGIAIEQNSKAPILLLEDEQRKVLLPVWIGMSEASAIAAAAEGAEPRRPMTHDLTTTLLLALEAHLDRVDICALEQGTFFANLVLTDIDGFEHHIDCRPSDGVALALRNKAPIRVAANVFAEAQTLGAEILEDEEEGPVAPMALADDDDARDRLAAWLVSSEPEALTKYKM
ncbi:MAG: bifunctional nuclease family protein [Bradymonadia bacterium]